MGNIYCCIGNNLNPHSNYSLFFIWPTSEVKRSKNEAAVADSVDDGVPVLVVVELGVFVSVELEDFLSFLFDSSSVVIIDVVTE